MGQRTNQPLHPSSHRRRLLLRLEATPSFYDTPNPYLKLIPQTDASGAITTVDVAFYEDEAQAQRDEYIMYGSYFLN